AATASSCASAWSVRATSRPFRCLLAKPPGPSAAAFELPMAQRPAAAPAVAVAGHPALLQRLDDFLAHLLGVAEQHHRVVAEEQLVLDAGIARGHRPLDEQHCLRPL